MRFYGCFPVNVIRWADETSDHDFYAYYPYTEMAAAM